jgi:carbamoyl-phosphate synthase large subunit
VRTFKAVDTCAAEFEAATPYFYSGWERPGPDGPRHEVERGDRPSIVILGSGPNRIGQGIEFDYCCVHAAMTVRASGRDAVMVNCNPETVSTDYDTSDRLYFEPLTLEDVLGVIELEQPEGVIVSFGGQTPLRLARELAAAGVPLLGTAVDAIDLAEDRSRFQGLLEELELAAPPFATAVGPEEALEHAGDVGFPLLVRPSYVLGGRAMEICYDTAGLTKYLLKTGAKPDTAIYLDRFLENAIEIDVDALCDGTQTFVAAVMQHVEEAGVHSGDSSCVLPAPSLTRSERRAVAHAVRRLGPTLGVVGLLNVQLALADGELYVLEANPRASRTVPFASKATGVNLVQAACRLAAGATIPELELTETKSKEQVSVKAAVLPFARFPGADPVLGPEMRSTGEVMASASDLPTAFAKAERAAGRRLPASGTAFLSVRDEDKSIAIPVAQALVGLGFQLLATAGTARTLADAGLVVDYVRKVAEDGEGPTVVDLVRRGRCDLVINTPQGSGARTDGYRIREAALVARIPCITTISGAAAAVEAIAHARDEVALSLQERIDAQARTA